MFERDAGVGEGKERHHHVVDQGMQVIVHRLQGTDHFVGDRFDMTEDSAFRVAQHVFIIGHVGGFGKLLQAGPDFSDIFVDVQLGTCRDGEGYDDTGNGRMNPRIQE